MRYKISNAEYLKQLLAECADDALEAQWDSVPCLLWERGKHRLGYGVLHLESGPLVTAHRAAYELMHGELGPGWWVHQRCANLACVRRAHLFASRSTMPQVSKIEYLESAIQKMDTSPETPWARIPCLMWPWSKTGGYGIVRVGGSNRRVSHLVHEATKGPVPDGFDVCHHCDNPSCYQAAHLFVGTAQDNIDDMVAKGRKRSPQGESHGKAVLTEADVREVRRLHSTGLSNREISTRMPIVSITTAYHIITGRTWRHVLD